MRYNHIDYLIQCGLYALGFDVGPRDGLKGTRTARAIEASVLARGGLKVEPLPSSYLKPPRPTTGEKTKTFGAAGEPPMKTFKPPYPMTFSWGGKVTKIGCHELIATQLQAALTEIAGKGSAFIEKYGLDQYAGCYNNRKSRSGSSLSDHAWAIAIDLNPDDNGNHQTWMPGMRGPGGKFQMPVVAVNIFKKHGFQVGFQQKNGLRRDMMHISYINRQ